jgi:hypothetical protein
MYKWGQLARYGCTFLRLPAVTGREADSHLTGPTLCSEWVVRFRHRSPSCTLLLTLFDHTASKLRITIVIYIVKGSFMVGRVSCSCSVA